jgi:hypothetical protein
LQPQEQQPSQLSENTSGIQVTSPKNATGINQPTPEPQLSSSRISLEAEVLSVVFVVSIAVLSAAGYMRLYRHKRELAAN